jgi:60 kDa SS-A/Ro ribonucleoprotein
MSKYNFFLQGKNQPPQSAPLPGTTQVANSAGGYAWEVNHWDRLRRFLVLGSEGGSYYATPMALTIENANNVLTCLQEDGVRVVNETVTISHEGRAPKNDPAIFVLALAAGKGDEATRKAALAALPRVCRIGTHLFAFAEYVQAFRGWGRGLRRGIAGWYQTKETQALAYQVVKYRQRNGWTHTDVLRLAHPKPDTPTEGAIYNWVTRPDEATWARDVFSPNDEALAFIWAFEQAQQTDNLDTILKLIAAYDLPREALPTQWLKETAVWEALLAKMPMTAMLRNLATMTRVGLLTPLSEAENTVVERLTDVQRLRRARIHPIAVLSALRVYALGYSLRGRTLAYGRQAGKPEWQPTQRVMDALDEAFYLAFQNIEPANKRVMLALDVSGSMTYGAVAGVAGLTPRDGAAAMALVTARTEAKYTMTAFSHEMVPFKISRKMRLDDVIERMDGLPFGGTDCALPMVYALERKIKVDTFVVYTDSETWFGKIHPAQALQQYREQMGIPAQLVVVAMMGNKFSIADPKDAGMLDVVGFDSATPGLIADFARGQL